MRNLLSMLLVFSFLFTIGCGDDDATESNPLVGVWNMTSLSFATGGETLTFATTQPSTHGTLSGTPPNLAYTPNPDYVGSDSFSFTVNGNGVESHEVDVTLTILPINDAPLFSLSGDVTLEEDFSATQQVTVTPAAVPSDESGQTVIYSLSPTTVDFAAVSIDSSTGQVSVSAVSHGNGSQLFTITADDQQTANNSTTQTFTLTVNPVNDAPVASDQSVETPEDTPVTITLTAIDVDTRASYKTCAFRSEEHNNVGNLFWFTKATERYITFDKLSDSFRIRFLPPLPASIRKQNRTGGNRVDTDIV